MPSIELNVGQVPSPRRQLRSDDATPFRIVVLGDFSGRPSGERGPLARTLEADGLIQRVREPQDTRTVRVDATSSPATSTSNHVALRPRPPESTPAIPAC